jgi:hypothetical protein
VSGRLPRAAVSGAAVVWSAPPASSASSPGALLLLLLLAARAHIVVVVHLPRAWMPVVNAASRGRGAALQAPRWCMSGIAAVAAAAVAVFVAAAAPPAPLVLRTAPRAADAESMALTMCQALCMQLI